MKTLNHYLYHLNYIIFKKYLTQLSKFLFYNFKHIAADILLFNKLKIVYTVLIDEYDILTEPKIITKGWQYICYTNIKGLKSKFWNIIYIENIDNIDPAKFNRKLKILFHNYLPEHNISIYIDTRLIINCNLNIYLFNKIIGYDMALSRHFKRKTVEEEVNECIRLERDHKEILLKQYNYYTKDNFPDNIPLTSNGILIRKNLSKIQLIMEKWWEQVEKFSKRDQISLPYILWKCQDLKIKRYPFNEFESNFIFKQHMHKIKLHESVH